MVETRSLTKNFILAFVGNAVAAFCSWVLLVLLTKLATVEVVGIFAVSKAVCMPIFAFLSLQLTIVQTTDAQNDYSFGHYYALRIINSSVAIGLSVLVSSLFYSGDILYTVLLLSVSLGVLSVRQVFLGCLRRFERMDRVAVSRSLQGVLSAVLFGAIFWVSRSLTLSILGLIGARVIVLRFHDMPVIGKLLSSSPNDTKPLATKLLWSRKVLWDLTKTSLPLGLVGLFQALYVSMPRLVLDRYFGREQVGYFAAISSLLMAGTMVIAALGHAVTPRLAKYYFENLSGYRRLLGKLLVIGALLGMSGVAISLLFGKLILTLMFQADYAEYSDVFVWATIAGALSFVFCFVNAGLNAARKFKVQMPIYGGATATCFIFSLWLIPYFGMTGAVWAIIACYSVGSLSSAVFVAKAVNERALQKSVEWVPD